MDEYKSSSTSSPQEDDLGILFDHAGVGMAQIDPHSGRFLRVNRELAEMTGYSVQELLGLSAFELTHPDDREMNQREWDKTLSGKSLQFEVEKHYVRKDGRAIWVRVVAIIPRKDGKPLPAVCTIQDISQRKPAEQALWGEEHWEKVTGSLVRRAEGQPLSLHGIITDITQRKQAEEALRQSQERLTLTLEAGSLGIWDADLLNRRTYWSPEQERLFGLSPGSFDGHFSKWLHPEDRRGVLVRLAKALESEQDYQDEYRVVWLDGTVRWLAARGRIYRDLQGKAVRMLGVNYDITRRKEAEEQVRRYAESQRRFVADAAHELRAPLASVLGNLELLQRYPDMQAEDRHNSIKDAYAEASRMGRLVGDLLALARGDEGLQLRWQPVRLEKLLVELLRQYAPRTQGYRLEQALEPASVQGDPDRLHEVLLILLDNALKYTPSGGRIRLELQVTQGQAEVRVSDSGVGIGPDDLPHIFDRFYRADKSRKHTPDPGGSGLGLSIAKQIVEAHRGQIWLESEPGQGTTAVVQLPLLEATSAPQ